MKIQFPLLLALMPLATTALAQEDGGAPPIRHRHQLKWAMSDAVDPFSPTFMAGYERMLGSSDYSLLVEGGYVNSFGGAWVQPQGMTGFKLRIESRYYVWHSDNPYDGWYLGLQGMYKRTLKSETEGMFCRGAGCAYYQQLDYSFEKQALAGHASFGVKLGKPFVMDLSGFCGFRIVDGKIRDVPGDANFVSDNGFSFDQEGRQSIPSLGAALRIGVGW